jgi:hypothetical protein
VDLPGRDFVRHPALLRRGGAPLSALRYRYRHNRTIVCGTLTAMLALVDFGGVAATQTIFRTLTGQQQAIVISTLAIAALFNPLRKRVQAFVDRLFYRRKYDARKTLQDFSARLRDETDLDMLNDYLVGVIAETMKPAHVSLWMRPDPTLMISVDEEARYLHK